MAERAKSGVSVGWTIAALTLGVTLGGTCVTCGQALNLPQEESFGTSRRRVGVVELVGPIVDSTEVVRDIRAFGERSDLDAIVIRIDSPGGAVAPSQEIFSALRAVSSKKPVVASMGSTAASGGFWSAMGADWIFASPGSVTGSIGVISQLPDLRGLAAWLRIDLRTYKTGPHKDFGNPLREPSVGDELVMMDVMNDIYEQFVEVVAERRKVDLDAVRNIADGRVFSGKRALELGMIDQLGGLHDAAKKAVQLAEEKDAASEGRSAEAIDEDPTLVYPRKPGPGILRVLAEEGGAAAVKGAFDSAANGIAPSGPDVRVELK